MWISKGYKYRIYPNQQQQQLIEKTFGCCRFIYNQMLAERINIYEQFKDDKESLYSYKYKTEKQFKEEYHWLREVDSIALQQSRRCLETAYKNFFAGKGKVGFPKFKSKKNRSNLSYTTVNVSNSIRLDESNKYIKIPKLNFVRIKLHRQLPIDSIIKHITISKTSTNKYYVSICIQYELNVKENQLNVENSIGLDYSSHDFYVDSNGNKAEYPRYFRLYQSKLVKEQRKLSNMKIGSNNYNKQKLKVAKVHEDIASLRNDFLHKLSTQIANKYDYVFVEDIDLRNISQCLKLGKSTFDNSFGKFRELLAYKMFERGKVFHKIDKWQPTTVICSNCGSYHKSIINSLSIRSWTCPDCGAIHDRDVNAAKNIRKSGILSFQ